MAARMLLAPQFQQQRHHQGAAHPGLVYLAMAPRPKGS